MKKVKKAKAHHLSASYANFKVLDELRKRCTLTVTEIALILSVSRPHYHRMLKSLEAGDGALKLDIDIKVQKALSVLAESSELICTKIKDGTDAVRSKGVRKLALSVNSFRAMPQYISLAALDITVVRSVALNKGAKRRATSKS